MQAKAMMSDRFARGAFEYGVGSALAREDARAFDFRDTCEAAASGEVERILAKTEAGCSVPMLGLVVWQPYTPLACALADALRAFAEV